MVWYPYTIDIVLWIQVIRIYFNLLEHYNILWSEYFTSEGHRLTEVWDPETHLAVMVAQKPNRKDGKGQNDQHTISE